MKSCSVQGCELPAFRTDKNTQKKYCTNHWRIYSTDIDKRSPIQKHFDKQKSKRQQSSLASKVRKLGMEKEQETGLSGLIADLDFTISRYLRLREMDSEGLCTCYICGSKSGWKSSQVMHYIPRANLATRFLLDNLRVGDIRCNVFENGNLELYAEKLNEEKPNTTEYLTDLSREICKPTQDELKVLLSDYRAKLRVVEEKLNNLQNTKK